MNRMRYKLRRYNKIIQVLGIILAVIGLILILKTIPIQIWIFILGLIFVVVGLIFFKLN